MNMPLVLLNRRRRGSVAFSPVSLFAASEPGVWYDPSDLTTMFQDTAGTTPVTTPGQTVALALDKSKGLVLGSELVTNGDFSGGSTGWITTSWVISGGKATISNVSDSLAQNVTLVAGKAYRVEYTLSGFSGTGAFRPRFFGGTTVTGISSSANGTYVEIMTAVSGNTQMAISVTTATCSGSVDNISVKELPGFHATQATAASRPTYQSSGGRHWLAFDGVDDSLVTSTITPGIDKVQVFAGVRKLSDAARGMLAEPGTGGSNGSFAMEAPNNNGATQFAFRSIGTSAAVAAFGGEAAPITKVVTGLGDIAAPSSILRLNGTQVNQNTNTQGTGNYLAYLLHIGRRGGTSLPLNGQIYSLIVRFGANLDAGTITSTETFVNGKTGAF
jgi:hypothetical protein